MSDVLNLAKTQIGVQEIPKGSNWGDKVKEYLAAVNIGSPAPWCCAFVVWCFRHCQKDKTVIPTTGSCTFLLNWAKEQGKLVKQPRPGDVFLLLRPGGKSAFHTGLVSSVGALTFGTIEGNSNPGGSPEGYEVVARVRRKVLASVAFLRLTDGKV